MSSNRSSSSSIKDSSPLAGSGRNRSSRGGSLLPAADENLQLFSKIRRTFSLESSHSDPLPDVPVKLGRISIGSGKLDKNGIDDLMTFPDGGKNDYDWLLTPPGTPLVPSDGLHHQPKTAAPRSSSASRNGSTMKTSRLSVSQTESIHSSRPTRSSSVTRPSVSASQHISSYSLNRSSSILNTSSASVSSYIRPSSPMMRSQSASRPSTSTSRSSLSRSTTPSGVRSMPSGSSIDKPRPTSNSRPSTPTSRTPNPPRLTSSVPRSNSRPSTPNRRTSAPSLATMGIATAPGRRQSSGGLSTSFAAGSRPSSPSPRLKPLQQPSVLPAFPNDTPANLRTTLPDRPLSAGRLRPSLSVTGKGKTETPTSGNAARRQPSPVGTKGRLSEPSAKVRTLSNGHAGVTENYKIIHLQDMNKSIRIQSTVPDNNGFGRIISKKSVDMTGRNMDIRNGAGNSRQLSGTALFPQSIRSSASVKTQAVQTSCDFGSTSNLLLPNNNGNSENGRSISTCTSVNGRNDEISHLSANLRELDSYESSRYDAILLKEDLKNTNWLHSFDERSNQGSLFDSGFESLPEPFDPL